MSDRKNILPGVEIETNKSLASSFNSAITTISYLDNVAYQINIRTSDSTGTFKVQGSIDYKANSIGDNSQVGSANWVDLTLGGGTPSANAANDSIIIDLNQLPFNAVRLVYTSTIAGTGHCDIWIMAKEI